MQPASPKIVTVGRLRAIRDELRAAGKTVVQCHGCFDVVHPGHLRYLRFAREQGDVLVVSLTADEHVDKGYDRPLVGEDSRAECLAALEFVDYVCINRHPTATSLLALVEPDLYVKGREYETKPDPRFEQERRTVEGYGGRVIFSSGDVVYSSSAIIDRMHEQMGLDDDRVAAYCRRNAVTLPAIRDLLARIRGLRVLVLGDPIVDRYVHCEGLGAAAEGPMLAVTPVREETFEGGRPWSPSSSRPWACRPSS